jgi:septal ring factor EnvC (AmiA/AmiB activator)
MKLERSPQRRRAMRRSLTISFVALVSIFGAAACGERGADQQQEEQQQRIEQLEQKVEEQQQQISELQEEVQGGVPPPEEVTEPRDDR